MDTISGVAEAIKLLQNNCTYLNEQLSQFTIANDNILNLLRSQGLILPDDFCTLTEFNAGTISYVLRFVNYTGYTGPISFDPIQLIRLSKNAQLWKNPYFFSIAKTFYLYNLQGLDYAPLVGQFSIDGVEINSSAVIFPNNNKTPVSSKLVEMVFVTFLLARNYCG